jgi:hypothetical protein
MYLAPAIESKVLNETLDFKMTRPVGKAPVITIVAAKATNGQVLELLTSKEIRKQLCRDSNAKQITCTACA